VLTVRQLLNQLATLDPDLPVGVISIDRSPNSQRVEISTRTLIDVDVVHRTDTGAPRAVWLTAHSYGPNGDLSNDQPTTIVLPRQPCGCLLPIRFGIQRNVNLDAITCPHQQPDEIVTRSARYHGQ
jgi:hypothetical protein